MKKLLLLVIVLCVSALNAETIFFKKDGSPITGQEHEILYRIMLENQFPMSLMYGSYKPDEIKAMNNEISVKLPNSGIEAKFFPTTLYELFALNFIRDNFDNIEQATGNALVHYGRRRALDSNINNYFTPNQIQKLNLLPELKIFHGNLNNYILESLKKYHLVLPNTAADAIKIVDTIADFWKPLKVGGSGLEKLKDGKNLIEPAVIKKAIELEYNSFAHNKFPLYRGANVLDDEKDVRSPGVDPISARSNRSISFGSTLLGGIIFDAGTCAYCYMSQHFGRPIGYALIIDKNEYANGPLKNMFYIPETSSLLDLIAAGEFFHSRSKVPDLMHVNKFSFQQGQMGIESLEPFISYYQIVAPNKEKAQEIYTQILNYIRKNHTVIKQL